MLIALAALAFAALVVAAAAAYTRWITRSIDRREQHYLATIRDLNDRLMFATDKTWTPAPEAPEPERDERPDEPLYLDEFDADDLTPLVASAGL